jgi:pentamidine resistance factor
LALAANPVLQRLWSTPHSASETDTLNATNTLPIVLRSKDAVFHDVSRENADMQGLTLKFKQFTTYFKAVIYFYRIGIQNVWRNRKLMTQIKRKYHVESVEARGKVLRRKLRNGQDIVNSLIALETFERIEQEALKTIDSTLILNITRKEFQTVLRTERDVFKIPLFAIILVIFAEMTPLLCYMIPEIAPSTCVFPGLVKKMYHHATKAQADLSRLRMERYSRSYSHDEYPFQSVERLPDDELRLLAQSLNLISRYLPIGLYPSSILQSRIMKRFNEIRADNFFLVTGRQNLWNLNKNELIRCCIDRSLVDFSKDDLSHIGVHELRMRLFFFLGLCENEKSIGNVGLLGLNHLESDQSVHFTNIQQEEAHVLNTWWAEKHKTDIVKE